MTDIDKVLVQNSRGLICGETFQIVNGDCPELRARVFVMRPGTNIQVRDNTFVIDPPDSFGLSELHEMLRGWANERDSLAGGAGK